MAAQAWINQRFEGGQSTDKKVGIDNSFANSQSLDFRKSPSQLSVLPRTRRGDNNVVTDLIQNEVMTETGRIYSLGSTGRVYTWSPAGVVSLFGTVPDGAFGLSYRQDQDAIYITSSTTVSSITKVSSTPTLNPSYYAQSQSTYDNSTQMGFNVNSNQSTGSSTTPIITTYSETVSKQRRSWQTDINPVVRIGVKIVTKGTGNWTLVVHDGLNNQLGSTTIANANLTNNAWNYFDFSQINVNVGPNNPQTYHFHLTSTVADGRVSSTAVNDLSAANMELYADRLVDTQNGIHPMQTFQQWEIIGNGRYLSAWENLGEPTPSNSAWLRQKLTFPPGYEVNGAAVFNEYLVISTARVTTGANTPQDGIIFYWDGLSDTYNYFTRIPEGKPQAIHEYNNAIYYYASGSWYVISSVAATPTKIRKLPGSENVYTGANAQTELNPYMATTRYGIQLLGYPSTTGNEDIPYGVYSWGQVDYTLPMSFGYSYILSTGSQYYTVSNGLKIGMVKNFGNILHVSWEDSGEFGVDVVDTTSIPVEFATWESTTFDNGYVGKLKTASYMDCSWLEIQDGVEIVLKYKIDRGDWVYSDRWSNDNPCEFQGVDNYARFDVGTAEQEARFKEIEVGIDIYCDETVTEPPVIVQVGLIFDSNTEEDLQ